MRINFILLSLVVAMSSCSDIDDINAPLASHPNQAQFSDTFSSDSVYINRQEIYNAATLFKSNLKRSSRSSIAHTIKTIEDNEGNPAIYAINFNDNDGFLLLSARKTFHPVIAYSGHGHFEATNAKGFLKEWIDQAVNIIEHSSELHPDSLKVYKREWHRYELFTGTQHMVASRALDQSEFLELQTIFQSKIGEWISNGWEYYDVRSYADIDPVNNSWVLDYEGGIYPQYIEDFERLSFVVIPPETSNSNSTIGETKCVWDQIWPYNTYFPFLSNGNHAYVGCSTIAAAHIMFTYQYPKNILWNNISLNR